MTHSHRDNTVNGESVFIHFHCCYYSRTLCNNRAE